LCLECIAFEFKGMLFWHGLCNVFGMRNTEKLEAMLSLMIVVGMFLLLLDFSPMTATAAAESLEGMPVLTGKTLGK